MNLIYTAILILAAFIAIWIFVVVPAEKRHHERKLEMIKKRIADREVGSQNSDSPGSEQPVHVSESSSRDDQ